MFKYSKHIKLWKLVKQSWNLVREHGLVNTKIFLRRCYLNDQEEIPNSCYACLYAEEQRANKLVSKCRYCPLEIGECSNVNSIYRQICNSITSDNRAVFEGLCDYMIDAKVKPDVECEVDETNADKPERV